MHRLRLLLLLSLMFAVSGTVVARAQDGTSVFNDQDQKSDVKHDKAKNKDQSNDGHRRHWWSPPHWFHKKHHDKASAKSKTPESSKTVAAKDQPTTKPSDIKPLNTSTTTTHKAEATTTAGSKTATATKTRTATGARKKTVARAKRHRRTTAGTTQGKSTAQRDCTPEEAKKGGCTASKTPAQKGTTSAAAVKPS